MFNSFDRSGHRHLSAEITAELATLGQRLGLTFTASGGTIGDTRLVIKIEAASADPTAAIDKAKREIDIYGRSMGLTGADHGTVFVSQGKRFKFTGLSLSRPKFPIDGECLSTGRSFKFTRASIATIIAARPKAPSPAQASVSPPPARTPEKLDPRFANGAQF